ncbi:hypothetical protein Tco_0090513 [Tanacetum coccineum]
MPILGCTSYAPLELLRMLGDDGRMLCFLCLNDEDPVTDTKDLGVKCAATLDVNILGIIPESSPEMYFQSEPLLLDSKVTIFQAGWHTVYSVNGLEYNLSEIEELRSVAHLGPLKYISPGRITGFMQMSSQQQLLYLEDAAGIGSLKKDLASKRLNLVELITREAGGSAAPQKVASEYYNLQVQETTLRRRLADLNKQTKTCQNNIVNTNRQIEALSKKLQEASAQESTLLEEDRRQTELYDFARLLSHNQCELTATSDLLSNGQEAEAYLQKRAEELGPAQVDANRRFTEERTKVDMLQETLDTLDAAVSKDVDTALPRATKKLKGEGPGKITKAVCLYYSSGGFHELIGKHNEKAKEMEKLRSSLSGFQKNFDLIQEESGDIDQKLKELGVKMKKWEKSVTSLSRTADDIKRKFPNLDLDLDKAKAAQIAARDKLRMVTDGNAKLLREILALKDKFIEGGKTETDLSVSVTETQSRLENLNSLMRSMIAKDPWISQEHSKFGKKNSSYDFKKDDPTKAREQARDLEREEKFNGVVVRSNIDEMYERTLKEEGDLHADLKKIQGESSSCQQTISVLESKFRTSIAQLQRDFKAASSQMLPQHKLIELVMGEDHLDATPINTPSHF